MSRYYHERHEFSAQLSTYLRALLDLVQYLDIEGISRKLLCRDGKTVRTEVGNNYGYELRGILSMTASHDIGRIADSAHTKKEIKAMHNRTPMTLVYEVTVVELPFQ